VLDPLVRVDEPDDPMSPRYPAVLLLERDWLLRLKYIDKVIMITYLQLKGRE
jgi:hypothetical protein